MGLYFGTDGIRGLANIEITPELSFRAGNALAQAGAAKIVVVRDTRDSGDLLALSFCAGALADGCNVVYAGIVPTAAAAILTCLLKTDFGAVISASHNPPEYNGIKLFSSAGLKLSEKEEGLIESLICTPMYAPHEKIGRFTHDAKNAEVYEKHLLSGLDVNLKGMKIVLDCANGAAAQIAPKIFRLTGAAVTAYNTETDGKNINESCGALYPEFLAKKVIKDGADIGFCFDGDADRLIAVDGNGNIVDGDTTLYILACAYKEKGLLKNNCVVGTSHTNMAIQEALEAKGVTLLRADIGDKYVSDMMIKEGAALGGEQSGHIIIRHLSPTGDGILTALQLAQTAKSTPLASLADIKLFPQTNLSVTVKDKKAVINNERLWDFVNEISAKIKPKGRVLVRASGTEPKIRIVAECRSKTMCDETAFAIKAFIEKF